VMPREKLNPQKKFWDQLGFKLVLFPGPSEKIPSPAETQTPRPSEGLRFKPQDFFLWI